MGRAPFGPAYAPPANWCGFGKTAKSAARLAGLAADEREWLPHVTIGYVSHSSLMLVADWLQRHRQFHAGPAEACAFGMYESVRTGHAIEYRLVRSYELAA